MAEAGDDLRGALQMDAAQFAQLLEVARAPAARPRTFVRPTEFSGRPDESLASFRATFQACSATNEWDIDEQGRQIVTCLKGDALLAWARMPPADMRNIDRVMAVLEALFGTAEPLLAGIELRDCKQGLGEDVKSYVRRLTTAFHAAYKNEQMSEQLKDSLMREGFVAGLQPVLRDHVLRSRPATFQLAADMAEREESIRRMSGSSFASMGTGMTNQAYPLSKEESRFCGPTYDGTQSAFAVENSGRATSREQRLENEVAELKSRLGKMEKVFGEGLKDIKEKLDSLTLRSGSDAQASRQSETEANTQPRGRFQCFACAGPHLKRSCTVRQADLKCDICHTTGMHNTRAHNLTKNGLSRVTRRETSAS